MGATSVSAADLAMLKTGFAIRHERREAIGATTRLYLAGNSGYVDIDTDQIEAFLPDDTPPPAEIQNPDAQKVDIESVLRAAGTRHGIDPDFITSVAQAESGFNPRAVSPKGARGLMQLMPDTANKLGVKDSFDPSANAEGGTRYLRQLFELYHGDTIKALAAYNAGPYRVDQYHGIPPYRETHAYVSRIIRDYNRKKLAQQKKLEQRKTVVRQTASSNGAGQPGGGK